MYCMLSLSSQHTSALNSKKPFTQGYFVKNRNSILFDRSDVLSS